MCILTVVKVDKCGNILWTKNNCFANTPGTRQIILSKFDPQGDLVSTNRYNTNDTSNQILNPSIAVDFQRNTYLAFSTNGTVPGGVNTGLFDIVVMKLNPSGNVIWVQQNPSFNTVSNDISPKIQVDANFNVYLNYITQGTVNGGTSAGHYDNVVAKLNSNGNLIWIIQNPSFNTPLDDIHNSMDIDGLGNVYVAYQTKGKIPNSKNSGGYDIVVFKISNTGEILWAIEEPTFNTKKNDIDPSITVDVYGNSYIAYSTKGTIPHKFNVVNSGGYDIVLFKLNTNGKVIWRAQHPAFNTIDNDYNPQIVVDNKENLYLTFVSQNRSIPSNVHLVKFSTNCCFDCCQNCCQQHCNICLPKLYLMDLELCNKDLKNLIIKKNCDFKKSIILDKVNGILQLYHKELNTIKKSLEIINMIICSLNNLSRDEQSNICILKEIDQLIELYSIESNKCYPHNKICGDKINIYGTIEDITGMPLTYTNGFGGIRNTQIIGDLSVTFDNIKHIFNFTNICSVYELSRKINAKLCGKLIVIDGLEIGIKINCTPGTLILKICLCDGTRVFEFFAPDDCEHTYLNLMNQLNCAFGDLIEFICYDRHNNILNIIFKRGYTIIFSQKEECPHAQFIITTYVNCIPVNYGTTSAIRKRFIYGYLLFYNNQNNFSIEYPENSLVNTKVNPVLLKDDMEYFCENITLDLSGLIKCKLNTIDSISIFFECHNNKFDIKCFSGYSQFLKKIIKCIKSCCNICNIFKLNNILKILQQYRHMLQNSYKLIILSNNNFLNTVNIFLK